MSAQQALHERIFDINALNSAVTVLDWDQQTYMPEGGAEARGEHASRLTRMAHEMFVSDETRALLEKATAAAAPGTVDAAVCRVAQRELDLATKLPAELVARRSKLSTQAHEDWVKARKANDFKTFSPILTQMVDIARETADCIGYTDHVYDALTDQFEEGATKASWDAMFDGIREPLVNLVKEIQSAPNHPDNSFMFGQWDTQEQSKFTEELVQAIGFDFKRGRQDTAPHPFCTNFSVGDVRLTTRYQDYLGASIFGSLHEAGHGMYEQGSPMEWDRLPIAGGVSLGVHESQSRLWENIVGRSLPFWQHFLPRLEAFFPDLRAGNVNDFYRAINKVERSLIRVEADEVTYNLHIMIRYELECAMLTGELAVKDLPEAWNAKYEAYLGLTPPTDADGCLQDVHWSMGALGYFPTYSMGNILSYQIWDALKADIPNADELMANGHFAEILEWLRSKIYQHGSRYTPKELITQATGKPMDASHYLNGITAKYRAIYSL